MDSFARHSLALTALQLLATMPVPQRRFDDQFYTGPSPSGYREPLRKKESERRKKKRKMAEASRRRNRR